MSGGEEDGWEEGGERWRELRKRRGFWDDN